MPLVDKCVLDKQQFAIKVFVIILGERHMENIIEKIKEIEKLVCENFEALELDDPAEEGTYNEYLCVNGATNEQIEMFEEKFSIKMPEDMKELYRYKDGSKWFYLLFSNDKCDREFQYRLLSLAEIEKEKGYFQNKDALLAEFYSYEDDDFTKKLLKRMEDSRVKPYLFNKKWFPFAEASGDIHLMMDFDPNNNGTYGQIICYIHDPDEIAYVAQTITEIIEDTLLNIAFDED